MSGSSAVLGYLPAVIVEKLGLVFINSTITKSTSAFTTHKPVRLDNANVKFAFDGMILLAMGNHERVSAGVLDAMHHTPVLTISKIQNGKRSTIATLQGEQLRGTWNIDVDGVQAGIGKYYSDTPQVDTQDLRWAIDFNELYKQPLTIKSDALFSKIHFSSGLFYTRELSDVKYRF
ncbi:MAG: hypothetical protein AB1489_38880, partial [Acidobacteriota bacterium]